MIIKVSAIDESRAWTDWCGQSRRMLANRLTEACPHLRLTERKRLARTLLSGKPSEVTVEETYFESTRHFLESLGAIMSFEKKPD
ncbi:MAG: hypothetical protein WA117_14200, partial [Verrucomicrobiia bacterium]